MKTTISNKTQINVGNRVTWIGNLPGGYWDNNGGMGCSYSNRGSLYGVVAKLWKVNALIVDKYGKEYRVNRKYITNIEDLF